MVIDLFDVLNIDSLSSSHPIYVPVDHPEEIDQIFDSISYGKVNTAVGVVWPIADGQIKKTLARIGLRRFQTIVSCVSCSYGRRTR